MQLYEYDAGNNLLTIADADALASNSGLLTQFVYDAMNRQTSETFPDGGTKHYTYDGVGRLASRLDQANVLTQYGYDLAGRLLLKQYPDQLNDTFSYDASSRMLTAQSQRYNNTVTMAYDAAGRLQSESVAHDNQSEITSYEYDEMHRLRRLIYPGQTAITRTYTTRGLLDTILKDDAPFAQFRYDPQAGFRRTSIDYPVNAFYQPEEGDPIPVAGTLTASWQYDERQFVGLQTFELRAQIDENTSQSRNYSQIQYTWDALGRKSSEDAGWFGAETYGYDDEGRLTQFNRQNGDSQNWTLTPSGDWTASTKNGIADSRLHSPTHAITQRNGTLLAYDANGNLTQNDNGQTYTWDVENRLASATVNGNAARYTYDALGRRITKTVDNFTNTFSYAGWQEVSDSFSINIFGTGIDEILSRGNQYYLTNNVGTIMTVAAPENNIFEQHTYDAYGQQTTSSAFWDMPYGFTGRRIDAETGLYYYRNRYYSAELGRFISRDPAGYIDGPNVYQYVMGQPTMAVDPFGLAWHMKKMVGHRTLAYDWVWVDDGDCDTPTYPKPEPITHRALEIALDVDYKNRPDSRYVPTSGDLMATAMKYIENSAIPTSMLSPLVGTIKVKQGSDPVGAKYDPTARILGWTNPLYGPSGTMSIGSEYFKDIESRAFRTFAHPDDRLTQQLVGMLFNEGLHANVDRIKTNSDHWLTKRLNDVAASQYGGDFVMAEEALSETIADVADELYMRDESFQKGRPFTDSLTIKNPSAPEHNDPGEKWHGNPRSEVRLPEEWLDIAKWIVYNGVDKKWDGKPCRCRK